MLETSYRLIKSFERRIRRKLKRVDPAALPRDFEPEFKPIHEACRPFTMTGRWRMLGVTSRVIGQKVRARLDQPL